MDAGTETIRYIRFSDAETGQPIKRIKSSMSEPATELSLSKKVPSGDIMLQIKLHYGANGSLFQLTKTSAWTVRSIPNPQTKLFVPIRVDCLLPPIRKRPMSQPGAV